MIAPPAPPSPQPGLHENLARYQALAEDLAVTVAQVAVIQRQIDGLRQRIAERRAAVGRLAATSYRSYRADTLTVLVSAHDSTDLRDRMLILNVFARQRQMEITELSLATERYATAQRTLGALITQQKAQQEELIAQRHLLETQLRR